MSTYAISDVTSVFQREFEPISERFRISELTVEQAQDPSRADVAKPGVYVWWHPELGVVRVGRHLADTRKRALQHIRDDTGKMMAALGEDDATRLLLFTLIDDHDRHWAAAVEIYLEKNLKPKVPAKRTG